MTYHETEGQTSDLPKHELIGLFLGEKQARTNDRINYLEEKVRQLIQANVEGTTGGLPFNPIDLALPVRLWMDSSDEQSVAVNSDQTLSSWSAKVGGLTLTPDSSETAPSLTGQLNGLKTIKFDGTDYLQSTTTLNVVSSNQTWYLLFKATQVDSAQDALFTYGENYENGNWQLTAGDNSIFRGRVWKDTPPFTYPPFFSSEDLTDEWHLFTIEFDRENRTISAFIDGTEVISDHSDPYPINDNRIFKLFRNRANTNSPAGEVAEFMIQPTVNDSNRQLIEYYILNKWGLLSNLDDNNVYKDGTVQPSGGGSDDGQFIEDRTQTLREIGTAPNASGIVAFRISSLDGNAIIDPTNVDYQPSEGAVPRSYNNPQKLYGAVNIVYPTTGNRRIGTFWDIRGTYIYGPRSYLRSRPTYAQNTIPQNEFVQTVFAEGVSSLSDLQDSYLNNLANTHSADFDSQLPVTLNYQAFGIHPENTELEYAYRSDETIPLVIGGTNGSRVVGSRTQTIEKILNKWRLDVSYGNKLTFYSEGGKPVTGEFGPNALVEHWDGSQWKVALPNPDCDYTTDELAKIPEQYRSSYSSSGNANGSCAIDGNLNYDPNPPPQTQTVDLSFTDRWGSYQSVQLEMIWVEAGTFIMGSPTTETGRDSDETQRSVTLTKGFWMGKYQVTQAQYNAVLHWVDGNAGLSISFPSIFGGIGHNMNPNRPVENVSWNNAQTFLTRLNTLQSANIPSGWAYALPTEAQWEYACRAGTTTRYSFGNNIQVSDANFGSHHNHNETTDVGSFPPNPWGFHDMHGNVWEMCSDYYDPTFSYYGSTALTDPTGPASYTPTSVNPNPLRVKRGGSYYSIEEDLRSANRSYMGLQTGDYLGRVGFRIILQEQ